MILSRPPRQLSPLTNFEKEYYKYARKVNRALGDRFDPEWFFRKGSQAEQAYKDMEGEHIAQYRYKLQDAADRPRIVLVCSAAAQEGKELLTYPSEQDATETAQDEDLHNLERRKDRTLYLLAKKNRTKHTWQFRKLYHFVKKCYRTWLIKSFAKMAAQGGVEQKETLSQAAMRELVEEFGSDLDVWQTGKIPAAYHAYDLPEATKDGKTDTKVCSHLLPGA